MRKASCSCNKPVSQCVPQSPDHQTSGKYITATQTAAAIVPISNINWQLLLTYVWTEKQIILTSETYKIQRLKEIEELMPLLNLIWEGGEKEWVCGLRRKILGKKTQRWMVPMVWNNNKRAFSFHGRFLCTRRAVKRSKQASKEEEGRKSQLQEKKKKQ